METQKSAVALSNNNLICSWDTADRQTAETYKTEHEFQFIKEHYFRRREQNRRNSTVVQTLIVYFHPI